MNVNFLARLKQGLFVGTVVLLPMAYNSAKAFTVMNNLPQSPVCASNGSHCNNLIVYGDGGFWTQPVAPGYSMNVQTNDKGLYIAGNPILFPNGTNQKHGIQCMKTNLAHPLLFNGLPTSDDAVLTVSATVDKPQVILVVTNSKGSSAPFYADCTWEVYIEPNN